MFYYYGRKQKIFDKYPKPQFDTIIEPFAGNCDLIKFIPDTSNYVVEMFDIEPQTSTTTKRDTIQEPPSYVNKFVLTNPPYLARNKSQYKELFDKYNVNDLYKCFLLELLTDKANALSRAFLTIFFIPLLLLPP